MFGYSFLEQMHPCINEVIFFGTVHYFSVGEFCVDIYVTDQRVVTVREYRIVFLCPVKDS